MNFSSNKKLTHPKYRPDIDGLRAVAVLAVVAFHAYPKSVQGGFIGVDIFFVISGFLISTIIFENLERGTFSFADFYARRIKRIFPALTLVLLSCLTFGWFFLLADEYNQLGKHIAAGASFISNLVFWNESGYFDNAADTKPLLHLWSLGIEEQFYVMWPLLLWLSWKRKWNLLFITLLLTIASFALNIHEIKSDAVATFYSPLTRFWELLSGSLLAWATLHQSKIHWIVSRKFNSLFHCEPQKIKLMEKAIFSNALSVFGSLLLTFGIWKINKDLNFPGWWALVPVTAAMMLLAAGSSALINRTLLSNKVVVWFGLISFPLYLWHWPVLSFARIYENEVPNGNIRLDAVIISILLAWLTYRFIERPIRFGKHSKASVILLSSFMLLIGLGGAIIYHSDFSQSRTFPQLLLPRKGSQFAYGYSMAWNQGKNDWLFLGNNTDNTIAKLKLAMAPSESEIEATKETFSKLAQTAALSNTKVILIVGPNKSSIYPEFLPDAIVPSTKKYSSFFLDSLKDIPNLTVYNPTDDFLKQKNAEGILYWMTDTHWNYKGAFLAYSGFSKRLGLPVPEVSFESGPPHPGDLIEIAKLKNFPLHPEDNWNVVWKTKPVLTQASIADEQKTSFGTSTIVTNQNPLSNKTVWVVGDSFTEGLKQYFNASYKEVHYIGHWKEKLANLSNTLLEAQTKPDMIVIIRVERSF